MGRAHYDGGVLLVDSEVWFALGIIGWLRVILGVTIGAGVALLLALVTLACLRALFDPESAWRTRLYAGLVGVGVAWLLFVGARAGLHLLGRTVLGTTDDFVATRVEGEQLALVRGFGEDERRLLATLAGIRLGCTVEPVTGEDHGWQCRRSVELLWADGPPSVQHDLVEWGLSRCPGALENRVAEAQQVLAGAGPSPRLVVTGDCPAG